jgi:hypothetical protein
MMIRSRLAGLGVALLLLLAALPLRAQDIVFYWESWNSTLNVSEADQTITIAEAQTFVLESGQVRRASRSWADPVSVASVFVNLAGGELVELRRATSGESPGTYTVSASGDETLLRAYLPRAARGGERFTVQINYTTPLTTRNLVDWYAVPETRGARVERAVVRINFTDAEPPPEGLARVVSNNASLSISGRTVTVTSTRPLQDGEPLYVQMPFGEVGAASNSQSAAPTARPVVPTPRPAASTPAPGAQELGISLEGLLPLLCIVIVVVLLLSRGGGGGLGGLIGLLLRMFLGGGGGGTRGGGGFFPPGGGFGGSSGGSSGRTRPPSGFGGSSGGSSGGGFRRSPNQGRSVPTVRNRKGGGSAGLG